MDKRKYDEFAVALGGMVWRNNGISLQNLARMAREEIEEWRGIALTTARSRIERMHGDLIMHKMLFKLERRDGFVSCHVEDVSDLDIDLEHWNER